VNANYDEMLSLLATPMKQSTRVEYRLNTISSADYSAVLVLFLSLPRPVEYYRAKWNPIVES
jgi:hypothetical protein